MKANLKHPDIAALREMARRNGWTGCDAIGATLDDDDLADACAVVAGAIQEARS